MKSSEIHQLKGNEMKPGKQEDCIFNDEIDINLSPDDVNDLILLTENEALDAINYGTQGVWRKLKDKLQSKYDDWRKQRNEKDE